MKQALQLRIGQHLTMTPQLQQAIRLLQLSTMELQTEVQQALESNMMLETAEDSADAFESRDGAAPAEQQVEPTDIPKELEMDSSWEDYVEAPSVASYSSGEFDGMAPDAQHIVTETLVEHLRWQLGFLHLSDIDFLIADALIDAIDDDGYLRMSLEEILDSLGSVETEIELDEVEAVLHQIQNFDPSGVGARDLGESLLIQLRQLPEDTPHCAHAIELVSSHLDLLASHDYKQLMRRLRVDEAGLKEIDDLIRSLDPRPGGRIASDRVQYIVPDVFVAKKNGEWLVELNPDVAPKIRINSTYASFIKRADNSDDNNNMRNHLQEARWFLKSLKSRSDTMLKVSRCIVDRQQMFFEYGDEGMKPMVLHDIAEQVEMHESTISRVTTQKYMHTPRGIYELKYFFSSHISTASGGEASSTAIRALIKKLIAAENTRKPLSDSKLAGILADNGFNVARRTVAKYREAMSIASSSERKRLA